MSLGEGYGLHECRSDISACLVVCPQARRYIYQFWKPSVTPVEVGEINNIFHLPFFLQTTLKMLPNIPPAGGCSSSWFMKWKEDNKQTLWSTARPHRHACEMIKQANCRLKHKVQNIAGGNWNKTKPIFSWLCWLNAEVSTLCLPLILPCHWVLWNVAENVCCAHSLCTLYYSYVLVFGYLSDYLVSFSCLL